MPQFVAVIIRDLTWVLPLSSSFLVSNLAHVDSGGRGASGFPGIPLVSMLLLLFILSSFIGRLAIGEGGRRSGGGTFTSGFIFATHRSLGLDFVSDGVSGLVPSEDLYISLLYVKTRL